MLLTETAVTWQLLLEPAGRSGAENMAVDAALLAEAGRTGRAFLRLYRFAPPCLSLGRNEPTARYDRAEIGRLGIEVVRRPTGGRAVWHEHEVTYAVATPVAAFGGLRRGYRAIQSRLAAALRTLGADAQLAPEGPVARPTNHLASCFATPVCGEVLVAGRKVIGSAQVREGSAFLQHGSILLAGSQDIVDVASRQATVVSEATTLSDVLGRPVSFAEVADAVIAAWGEDLTSTALCRPLPPSTALFSSPAWTWRR